MRVQLARSLVFGGALLSSSSTVAWAEWCADPTVVDKTAVAESRDECTPADRFLVLTGRGAYFRSLEGVHFGGGGVELALAAWRHPAPFSGPSHGELSVGFTWMEPVQKEESTRSAMATIDIGFRFTFQRSITRKHFIPFYGLRAGRVLDASRGEEEPLPQRFTLTPSVGLFPYWWAGEDGGLFLSAIEVGFTGATGGIEQLMGLRVGVGVGGGWW